MKITCSKNQFLYGVNTVSKAVSNKTTMDILQCILIEAYDDCIKLTANDTELGIETVIEGTIIEPGNTLGENWTWRMKKGAFTPEIRKRCRQMNRLYGRRNSY